MDVSILIVNYRTWGHCAEALESIALHPPDGSRSRNAVESRAAGSAGLRYEVVVVDNASPPPPPLVRARFERALASVGGRLIRSAENIGYARAANLACRATTGRCVVVSNADVIFQKRTIGVLVDYLLRHRDAGAVGPEVFWDDSQTCRMPDNFLPAARHQLYELAMRASPRLERRFARRTLRRQLALWQSRTPTDVDMLTGCCLALRRDVIDAIGLFDEQFPLFLEDADLAMRLRREGLRSVVVKPSTLVHKFSRSVGMDPETAMAKYWTSLRRYHAKWHGRLGIASGRVYRSLTERWQRAGSSTGPPPWVVDIESAAKPVLNLPRHCASYCVQVAVEPSFQAMSGVLGSGDSWTPDDSLFARFGQRAWFRVFDLSSGSPTVLRAYRFTRSDNGTRGLAASQPRR